MVEVRLGRQALCTRWVILSANWVEVEMAVSSMALELWRSLVFPSPSLIGSLSPTSWGKTLDPRVLQRIFTGCLHLWLCCDLFGGGIRFCYPSSDLYLCICFFSLARRWPQPQPLYPPAVCTLIDESFVGILVS